MSINRENLVLFFFAIIAVILITITVSLQLTIWSNQRVSTDVVKLDNSLVLAAPVSTSKPSVIHKSTQILPLPTLPTPNISTPIPTVTLPPVVLPPTEHKPVLSMAALPDIAPTAPFTPIPIPTEADLRLGYIERNGANCGFFTQLMKLILEREAGLVVDIIEFRNIDEFYAMLASTEQRRPIDLTFCFIDPDDRTYIQKYFGYTKLIGSAYWHSAPKRLQIMANASIVAPMKRNRPCLYSLLQNLKLEDIEFQNKTASQWLAENAQVPSTWIDCGLKNGIKG